ncbi:MAG TPA: ATP-binding protein [Gillisia sp.]|nr:ATP-binding protein [Gillisia sp.]
MKKNNDGHPISKNGESIMTALELSEEALEAKDEEKNEIAVKLATAVKELSFQITEKEKRADELLKINEELAYQIREKEKRTLELEEVNNELEAFSYSVSHDLRAPLRAISGFSEVLAGDYIEQMDGEAKILFSEIIRNARKMGELIDNLLEFSRLSKQDIFRGTIDMKEIVENIVADQVKLEPKRKIDISIQELPKVEGDKNMLKQLIFNLVSNAFKYTGKKENVNIEIGSYSLNAEQVFYVKDNGAGFDPRYYDKLFGVFQRLHSSMEFEGTGVGLAIVQKIATKHGGEVWAEGKVGEGACFYFSLPLKIKKANYDI